MKKIPINILSSILARISGLTMDPIDDASVFLGIYHLQLINFFESVSLLPILLSIIIIILISIWIVRKSLGHDKRMLQLLNKLPGAKPHPILGNAVIFLGDPTETPQRMEEYFKTYGKCCKFWKVNMPYVMVCDPLVTERILSSPNQIEKGEGYGAVRNYFGKGLVTGGGDKWRKDRKELNAGLKHGLFETFLQSFNVHADELVDNLRIKFQDDTSPKDVLHELGDCTLKIVCEAGMGKPEECDRLNGPSIVNASVTLVAGVRVRIFKPWLQLPIIWKYLGNGSKEDKYLKPFQNNIIKYVDKQRKEQAIKKSETNFEMEAHSILDILLDNDSKRNDQDIYDHVITVLVAGTDTSASGLNYTLWLLALYPHHQKKVHEEIDGIFANRKDKDIKMGDLAEMKYLEMCIKESLRIYPPVPLFSRTMHSDVPIDDELCIPKGVSVMLWPYYLHRDPDIFPEPELFDPLRFTPEASSKRNLYSYIPFSAGLRNCIGQRFAMMEMKVILTYILRNFTITTTKSREELKVVYGIVLETSGSGLPMIFTSR